MGAVGVVGAVGAVGIVGAVGAVGIVGAVGVVGVVGIVGAVGYKLAPAGYKLQACTRGKTQIILESLGGGNTIIRKIY